MISIFAARIDDGDEMDDWNTSTDYRTGDSHLLRAGCWFQANPNQPLSWAPAISPAYVSTFRTWPIFDTLSSWWW